MPLGQASTSGGARGESGSGGAFAGTSWHPDMPGYGSPSQQGGPSISPSQYDPPKTGFGSFLGHLVGGLTRLSPFGSGINQASQWTNGGLTPAQIAERDYNGYAGMSFEERGAWQDRRESGYAANADRGGDRIPLPFRRNPPPPSGDGDGGGGGGGGGGNGRGGGERRRRVPVSPSDWSRVRQPNPLYLATYGQGPGHSFFSYEA